MVADAVVGVPLGRPVVVAVVAVGTDRVAVGASVRTVVVVLGIRGGPAVVDIHMEHVLVVVLDTVAADTVVSAAVGNLLDAARIAAVPVADSTADPVLAVLDSVPVVAGIPDRLAAVVVVLVDSETVVGSLQVVLVMVVAVVLVVGTLVVDILAAVVEPVEEELVAVEPVAFVAVEAELVVGAEPVVEAELVVAELVAPVELQMELLPPKYPSFLVQLPGH